jgi:DNA replication protein DnaC
MINPLPELTPMLKQLRLSNMAETLAQRNREAIGKQLSYPEFLALLVQDEVARRDQKKYDSRLRRAGFRANKTIESFDMNFNPGINIQQINELTSCNFIDERVAVLIAGPCGTGKSHLAQAIGHCAVQKGYDVAFYTQAKLLAYLNAARATNMYERRFQALVKVPLLIIDDFGLKPLKSPQDEDIHDLIDERYENTATIITSNLDYSEWGDAFPNKLLGAATLDRLRHNAYRVTLEGDSYRSKDSRQK